MLVALLVTSFSGPALAGLAAGFGVLLIAGVVLYHKGRERD
jgi:hypothetical protein